MKLTVGDFRRLTENMSDDVEVVVWFSYFGDQWAVDVINVTAETIGDHAVHIYTE